jgi:hypothetical protein
MMRSNANTEGLCIGFGAGSKEYLVENSQNRRLSLRSRKCCATRRSIELSTAAVYGS